MFLPHRIKEARGAHLDHKHPGFLSQETVAHRMTVLLRQRFPERWDTKRIRARQILRWENGQNIPRGEFVEVLALATDREIAFFFGDDDEEKEAALPSLDDILQERAEWAVRRALAKVQREVEA